MTQADSERTILKAALKGTAYSVGMSTHTYCAWCTSKVHQNRYARRGKKPEIDDDDNDRALQSNQLHTDSVQPEPQTLPTTDSSMP